ncbi:MAG TPA: hypothetical protein VI461_15215 [Chitinophagaceae bacterium]|nr:hypothetical protein [Chitinophagaceae bacterium]
MVTTFIQQNEDYIFSPFFTPGAATSATFKKAQRKESKGGSYGLFD